MSRMSVTLTRQWQDGINLLLAGLAARAIRRSRHETRQAA
jgi:hypothetical protein